MAAPVWVHAVYRQLILSYDEITAASRLVSNITAHYNFVCIFLKAVGNAVTIYSTVD